MQIINPGTILGASSIVVNSASAAMHIEQQGSGNALEVYDVASDTTPFVVDAAGLVAVGGAPIAAASVAVVAPITGGTTAYGLVAQQTIQSDVTTAGVVFATNVTTLAAAFTLTNLRHFSAASMAFGAGSAVTNQYGFNAGSNLTGATNNYGFYGNIAAAAGRYNFYANGTAANFFAGDMQLGKTVAAAGTTGAQTINKTAGTVNFAALAASLVVTNSLVTASSVILATVGTVDATMSSVSVVAGAGSFTITPNAAPTAETRVNFVVFN